MKIYDEIKEKCLNKGDGSLAGNGTVILCTGLTFVNLPLGLTAILGAVVYDTIEHKLSLSDTPMSDGWLKEVSETKDISKKGLVFLAKKVENKGYVSVKDALKWSEIENKLAEEKKIIREKSDNLKSSGALALLERTGNECKGVVSGVGEAISDLFNKNPDKTDPK